MEQKTTERSLIKNRAAALIWRAATAALCLWGLYPMFFGQTFSKMSLSYFTTQSNLLIAALFLVLAAGTAAQLISSGASGVPFHIAPWLQLGVVFFIQITFLVYAFMLSGGTFSMGGEMALSTILLHYAVPIMALIDFVLFLPHGRVSYKHAALWLVYPAAYVGFCFIRAELGPPFWDGSRFPYFFMDADKLGLNLLWIAPLFFAGYFALGCLLVRADRLLARKNAPTP